MFRVLGLVGLLVLSACGELPEDDYPDDLEVEALDAEWDALDKTTVGCKGPSCVGKAPDTQGCSADAVTKATLQRDNVTIKEKYSKACQSTWSYVSRTSSGYISVRVEWGIKDSDGIWIGQTASSKNAMSIKSPMGDASPGLVARACGKGSESAKLKCTAW